MIPDKVFSRIVAHLGLIVLGLTTGWLGYAMTRDFLIHHGKSGIFVAFPGLIAVGIFLVILGTVRLAYYLLILFKIVSPKRMLARETMEHNYEMFLTGIAAAVSSGPKPPTDVWKTLAAYHNKITKDRLHWRDFRTRVFSLHHDINVLCKRLYALLPTTQPHARHHAYGAAALAVKSGAGRPGALSYIASALGLTPAERTAIEAEIRNAAP